MIVCVIPARGGSKGIIKKNLSEIMGASLLSIAIRQAQDVREIDRILVSTDDYEIGIVAKAAGAEFVERPAKFADDYSPSEDAIKHAISTIAPEKIDAVVFLQCTSPLRRPADIRKALHMVTEGGYDSVLSVTPQHQFLWEDHGNGAYPVNYNPIGYRPMRQSIKHYVENGAIYVFKPWVLDTYNSRLGGKIGLLEMSSWCRFEIDTREDLELVEWVYGREDLF
jgi:N-acylneuraminate cytidylyltransferase